MNIILLVKSLKPCKKLVIKGFNVYMENAPYSHEEGLTTFMEDVYI